jgi:twitching motility protein PilT
MNSNQIFDYLESILDQHNVSDFHLHSHLPLFARIDGEIRTFDHFKIAPLDLQNLIKQAIGEEPWELFYKKGDLDFAVSARQRRYRASAYETEQGLSLVLRVIAKAVPSIESLGLPQAAHQALDLPSGLILITGSSGSGKSTTLAAMIDKINRTSAKHIITIEDPIEYLHNAAQSVISQREVGRHTHSFATALRGALRQDPDVILVGELRDYETASLGMTAAETGHLVFATLHTNGAPETINRIVDLFPPTEQSKARIQLSQSLKMVLTQTLLKRRGGGRVGCFELMVNTPGIASLIREDKVVQIQNMIQTGAQLGMISMEKYKSVLTSKNII